MNTCHYYLIVEPLLQEYRVDHSVKPASSLTIETKSKNYKVSFYTNNTQIYLILIDIPDVQDEVIPKRDLEVIQTIKEHVLSVLRLTYDHDISLFPTPIWNFRKVGQEPSLHIAINKSINPNLDPHVENVRNVFVNTFPVRVQITLLSDSQNKRIPLQYRYLSLYKLLELEFKTGKKWKKKELAQSISKFEDEFKDFGKSKKLVNYLHDLRHRCAHIKIGKDMLAVTQLSNKDSMEVYQFLPFMTKICKGIIEERYHDLGFSLVDYKTFFKKVKEVR